jgi:hypothetical protein
LEPKTKKKYDQKAIFLDAAANARHEDCFEANARERCCPEFFLFHLLPISSHLYFPA